MVLLVLLSVILFTTAQAEIDLTPFANFTREIPEIAGHCNLIEGIKVEEDKSKYEGRWYGVYMGMTKNKTIGVTCLVWDTFFDQYGQFHNLLHLKENGIAKVLRVEGVALDEKKGIYQFHFGVSSLTRILISTFFYIDDEMYFWWDEECIRNKNTKRRKCHIR